MKAIHQLSMCALLLGGVGAAEARDSTLKLPFDPVLESAISSGKLDGTVKFYLSGKSPAGGKVLSSNAVTNKKTNGVGKTDEKACEWALLSALITLQDAARSAGANAVTNITSYYKKNEVKDSVNYECHAGGVIVGVTLKADLVKY